MLITPGATAPGAQPTRSAATHPATEIESAVLIGHPADAPKLRLPATGPAVRLDSERRFSSGNADDHLSAVHPRTDILVVGMLCPTLNHELDARTLLVEINQQPPSSAADRKPPRTNDGQTSPSRLTGAIVRLAQWARRRSAVHQTGDLKRTTDADRYRNWREAQLRRQLVDHFDTDHVNGMDVLDFGCGTGELCHILSSFHPRNLTGVDTSTAAIQRATASSHQTDRAAPVTFLRNDDHRSIPLPNASIDLVCCFDVLEHIPDPQAILAEWARVLRRDGRVWIWWSPWRGPYGHHLESLIPLPWIHLLVPERTLFTACAAIYDDPHFIPRIWDLDPATGLKKPNKWATTKSFYPFLNKLSRAQFEHQAREAGLKILRREVHGFSGSSVRRATRILRHAPCIGECVVSYCVFELTLP